MTLLEEARNLIKAYLAAKPHLSIASMAKSCGMPATTARAIVQGEIQKTTVEKITRLLLTFMDIQSVINLVAKYDEYKVHLGTLKILAERDVQFIPSNEIDWQDPDQEIVALASSPSGITANRIFELYGRERGAERLTALLEHGVLREINGRIRQSEENVLFSVSDAQKRAANQVDRWRPLDMDKGGFLYHLYHPITVEGHKETKEAFKVLLATLNDIRSRHQAADGDPVLLLTLCANLLKGSEK